MPHERVRRARRLALLASASLLCATLSAVPARAAGPGEEYGVGTACVFANLIYGPVKFLYATGGALVAGAAYAFSGGDEDVARPVVNAALRGDYVITPDHLRGKKSLEFIGRTPGQMPAEGFQGGGSQGPLEEGF